MEYNHTNIKETGTNNDQQRGQDRSSHNDNEYQNYSNQNI